MASRPHSFGRKNDFSHNMWDDSGFNERQNLNSPLEDHSPKRRRDPRESISDPLESRSDPLDLDTTQLYLNVTYLQRSCKKLNKLRKELERKKKSKAQKEKKQKAVLEDSKDFKQKKEAYRDLYNEILVERAAVESLFDTSGRPPDDNQSRRPIASERQKHKSQPHLTQMDTEECEKCHQKETKIWKLEADIDKYKKDILRLGAEIDHKGRDKQDITRDLEQKIAGLETQIVIERSEKEDALRRLSSISSNNNPNIPEVSDPSRPTKLSQQFSDLYDNEWADAFDELGNSLGDIEDKEIISYLLDVVLEIHSVCGELSSSKLKTIEEAFIKPSVPSDGTKVPSQIITTIKDGIKSMAPKLLEHVKKNVFDHLKAKFSEEPLASCLQSGNVKIYIDKCTEVCWNMSVHDPQMVMEESRSPDGNFDSNKHREYTQNGPYEEFVVWPVLYLYRRGPMLSKGVAQGTKDMK